MKIAFFCDEYPPRRHGGIGTFVKVAADTLNKKGHAIKIVEFGESPSSRDEGGINIITLKRSTMPKLAWLLNRLRLWAWITKASRDSKIDVFELPDYHGWLPFPPLGKCKAKIVVRLHQSASAMSAALGNKRHLRGFLCEYLTLRFNKIWIGVSKFILEHTTATFNLVPDESAVIYNPVTLCGQALSESGHGSPMAFPYILFVGSLTEFKGVITIAKAAKDIVKTDSDLHFVFVGGETAYKERPISEAILGIVGLENKERIHFKGWLPHGESLHWVRHALAVVLPSKLESFGLAPLEAMALGKPVVFTKAASGPEIITNGVDGFLVDPDDAETLKGYILKIQGDKDVRERMSRAAMQRSAEFSLEKFIAECESFYLSRQVDLPRAQILGQPVN